jgi:cell division protein FtsI (penicillin-binding protein 3)
MDVKRDIVIRLGTVYFLVALVAILIIGRIFQLQIFQRGNYENLANRIEDSVGITNPERGDIVAWDGKVLATSQTIYEIRMDLMSDAINSDTLKLRLRDLADSLSNLFRDKTSDQYYRSLLNAKDRKNRSYLIKIDASFQDLKRIKKFPILQKGRYKGGLLTFKRSTRIMPYNDLAYRTIGSIRQERKVGIEGSFDKELKGKGTRVLLKKISNNWIPVENEISFEALSGADIITTLDINYQDFAHQAMLEQLKTTGSDTGIVVLMEVKSGEIKAMVNLMKGKNGKYIEGANHAVGAAIEPGSTFKLASMMCGLEDGYFDLNDSVQTGNGFHKIHDLVIREAGEYGYGMLTVKEVFEKSSNVGTAKLIYKHYKSNPKKFLNRIHAMDIDKKVGIEIKGEPFPTIRYPGDPLWSGISLPAMSYGYEILLTPLQMLNFYNAVANDGVMVKPRLVRAIREHGKVTQSFDTIITNPSICSKRTLRKVKMMLEGVVEQGTAENIKGAPYKIAGKTGTSQIAEGTGGYATAHYASFVGYFPADDPQYSCIVVLKTSDLHNFYGSDLAAPIFRKIADKVYASSPNLRKEVTANSENGLNYKDLPVSKNGNIKDLDIIYNELRIPVKGRDKIKSAWIVTNENNLIVEYQNRAVKRTTVPLVIGMGLKDAVYLLESIGLKIIVKGKGTVIEQSIEAGSPIKKNQIIYLTLG